MCIYNICYLFYVKLSLETNLPKQQSLHNSYGVPKWYLLIGYDWMILED